MARLVVFVAAAAVGYVLTRAAWIFLDWVGVACVVVVLAAVAYAARRRRRWSTAAGLAAGAAVSAIALTL